MRAAPPQGDARDSGVQDRRHESLSAKGSATVSGKIRPRAHLRSDTFELLGWGQRWLLSTLRLLPNAGPRGPEGSPRSSVRRAAPAGGRLPPRRSTTGPEDPPPPPAFNY